MNQTTHKERSSSWLSPGSASGTDQNWFITVCSDSHHVFVHTHWGAKEPRKSFSFNSGRLQADRETSPCCQGPRHTGNGGEMCEVICSTRHLEGWVIVAEIFSATSAKLGGHYPALCLQQTLTVVEVWSSSYFYFFFHSDFKPFHVGAFPLESHSWLLYQQFYLHLPFLSHVVFMFPCSSFLPTSPFSHHFEMSLMHLGLLNRGRRGDYGDGINYREDQKAANKLIFPLWEEPPMDPSLYQRTTWKRWTAKVVKSAANPNLFRVISQKLEARSCRRMAWHWLGDDKADGTQC